MVPYTLFTIALFSACVSASTTALGGQDGTCSYTTIWYNSPAELQSALSVVSSSYSICSTTSSSPNNSPSTNAAPITATAAAATTSSCPLQPNAPCFYIIVHGESHIEGQKLGDGSGASNPRFDIAASIFYIDTSGHLHTADSYNGVTMTYYIGSESWWGIFPANYPQLHGSDYQPSTCTAQGNGTLDCFQYGGIQSDVMNVWEYPYPDSRAYYIPHWGPAGFMVPITLEWQAVACPALC